MRIGKVVWAVVFLGMVGTGIAHAQAPEAPVFQAPQLANRAELLVAFRQYYPLPLRKKGIGGVAQVRLFVDTDGVADSVRLTSQIGIPALDEAAVRIAYLMKFVPAQVDGEPRGLWLDLPITMLPPERIDSPSVNTIALANRAEILEALRENTPEALRAERVALQADLWVEVDPNGHVVDVDFERSTCVEDTDKIAYHLGRALRFEPAQGYEGPINGWTIVQLTFDPFSTSKYLIELEGEVELDRARRAAERDSAATERKPVWKRPEILNRRELEKLLVDNYPEDLRMVGIGGTTNIMVWVDEKGFPHSKMIQTSSGLCQLDLAALEVAKSFRFRPALKDGVPTRVVVTFPVTFRSN